VMEIWKNETGFKKPGVIHLNDSIGELGSNLDRHQHIGEGQIGIDSFAFFMQEYKAIPKIIETPKFENMDRINLNRLIDLA
jgi:deoxyribonuclease IV